MTVTKKTLEMVRMMEDELSAFHGIRHLWANQVANGAATMDGLQLDADLLLKEQKRRLRTAVYFALKLLNEMSPNSSPPHNSFIRRQEVLTYLRNRRLQIEHDADEISHAGIRIKELDAIIYAFNDEVDSDE